MNTLARSDTGKFADGNCEIAISGILIFFLNHFCATASWGLRKSDPLHTAENLMLGSERIRNRTRSIHFEEKSLLLSGSCLIPKGTDPSDLPVPSSERNAPWCIPFMPASRGLARLLETDSANGLVSSVKEICLFRLDDKNKNIDSHPISMPTPNQSGTFYERWMAPLDLNAAAILAQAELAGSAYDELKTIVDRLVGLSPRDTAWYARPAPSIITRGEATVLGLSDPRFAQRVLILDEDGQLLGFSNLRRILRMAEMLENPPLRENVHKMSSMADSLISTPKKFAGGAWITLRVNNELIAHYGEDCLEFVNDSLRLLPFMRHVDIVGGGLCAQACCFMASMISYDRVRTVCSIPEISFLGTGIPNGILRLTGLNAAESVTYFNAIGIGGTTQTGLPAEEEPKACHVNELFVAIKSYINSGCPILSFVDLGRMMGASFSDCGTKANNVYDDLKFSSSNLDPADRRHMVLLVGYEEHTKHLLFNDPAVAPFRTMPITALVSNACYLRPKNDKFKFGTLLEPPTIVPVVPDPRIKLGLLNFLDQAKGLFAIAESFLPDAYMGANSYPEWSDWSYNLKQIKSLRPTQPSKGSGTTKEIIVEGQGLGATLIKKGWEEERWVWLQTCSDYILVWDAEASPSLWNQKIRNIESFLICAGFKPKDAAGFSLWKFRDIDDTNFINKPVARVESAFDGDQSQLASIKVGVITSFSTKGIADCTKLLESRRLRVGLELYCFMIKDDTILFGGAGGTMARGSNICTWLADKKRNGNKAYVKEVAGRILQCTKGFRDCYAVSTYFPGITSDIEKTRDDACDALACVVDIVGEYNRQETVGKKIRVIEMVGGSLISHSNLIELGIGEAQAFVLDKKAAAERILQCLRKTVCNLDNSISIALELEPGCLYAISSWSDLVYLSECIEKDETLKGKVGFNCDIAHWDLASITPQMVLDSLHSTHGLIGARILNAHISGFGKGHFGDLCPNSKSVQGREFFAPWLNVIRRSFKVSADKGLITSGHVSLEMEVPKCLSSVEEALDVISSWC